MKNDNCKSPRHSVGAVRGGVHRVGKGVGEMNATWHIGRKAIIEYLRPYLDLSEDQDIAWNKVRRWKRRYSLPVETQPNGKPYIDEAVFSLYWSRYLRALKKKQ